MTKILTFGVFGLRADIIPLLLLFFLIRNSLQTFFDH